MGGTAGKIREEGRFLLELPGGVAEIGLEVTGEIGEFLVTCDGCYIGDGQFLLPEELLGELHSFADDKFMNGQVEIRFEDLFQGTGAFEEFPGQRVNTEPVVAGGKVGQDIVPDQPSFFHCRDRNGVGFAGHAR